MAAQIDVTIIAELTGLSEPVEFSEKFTGVDTPARWIKQRQVQATADTDEVLGVGDVATETLLIIKCVSNDVDVDLDYVSSFDADFTIQEGEFAMIPSPAGIIRLKNNDAGEQFTVEYFLVGSA